MRTEQSMNKQDKNMNELQVGDPYDALAKQANAFYDKMESKRVWTEKLYEVKDALERAKRRIK